MARVPPVHAAPPPSGGYLDRVRWLVVRNDNAGDCPPGGLLRVTGSDADGALTADQPDADGQGALLVAHPDAGIAAGGYGLATYADWVPAAYETGTPAVGETWGAAAGSWYLTSGQAGYRVVADPETTAKLVEVVRAGGGGGPEGWATRGKLDGALSYQGNAVMSVWAWNGVAEADTGDDVTVYDWLLSSGQTVAAGTQVTAQWDDRSQRYYVAGAQCA